MGILMKFREMKYGIKYGLQRMFRKYGDDDLFDLSSWFQTTFVKMLMDFEKNSHGYPEYEFEEIDDFELNWVIRNYKEIIKLMKKSPIYKGYSEDELSEDGIYDKYIRYRLIIRRIAYDLIESSEDSCSEDNEYWDKLWNAEYNSNEKLQEEEYEQLKRDWLKRAEEIAKYREDKKNEAMSLLSKYFFSLWD